jgi:lysophospholipase L1-like esterase
VCTLLILAGAAFAQTRYVAFGDSITEGVGDDADRAEPGYPPRLEDLLQGAGGNAEVVNRGVGGEQTVEGLSRIDSVLDEGGDVLLLMEGSNDLSRFVSLETILFNLDEMAARAERRGWRAVHATVIPRIPTARVDEENVSNQKLNQRIRELAGTEGRDLVDNFEVFSATPRRFQTHYLQDPEDHVGHPNALGYDLMARTFFDVLTGVDGVPPVPGRLNPANGAVEISPGTNVRVDVWDFGEGIDLAATRLALNGIEVNAELTGNERRAQLLYRPPRPLQGTVSVELHSRDLAVPPNVTTREIASFDIVGAGSDGFGDVDGDGRVDGVDLIRLARAFGASRGDNRYERDADLDDSGTIDGQDLAILASNFGRTSSSEP